MTHPLIKWKNNIPKNTQRQRLSVSKTYHVMIRRNERKAIFLDDDDRAFFVSTLVMKNQERRFAVYAYCLMDNHVHLIINIY